MNKSNLSYLVISASFLLSLTNESAAQSGKMPKCPLDGRPTTFTCSGFKKYPDGAAYEGQLINGQENGQGKITWPDNTTYFGQFKNGQPNGYGTKVWGNDQRKYVGNFENNQYSGNGTLYDAKGSVVARGIWNKDVLLKNDRDK